MEVAETKSILRAGAMLGNYRIQGFLGQGGFGVTYLALDTKLDLQVAIKEYMPEQLAARSPDDSVEPRSPDEHTMFAWGMSRFIKEAQTLARFNHPNIVRVMAVFEQNDTAYMVMEYERGQDLKALMSRPIYRSESHLKRIIGPVLDGLSEVHRRGYIHRDVKPANILIRENGTPVLLDFGSARRASPEHTQALTSLITVGYAPLEQYNSASGQEQGPWTDIYALAAVLYFAITGKAPVESTLRGSAVLNDKPDPLVKLEHLQPEGYSLAFCRAVDWGLGFKMADRPQSIGDWRPALLGELDDATIIAATDSRRLNTLSDNAHARERSPLVDGRSANDGSHAQTSARARHTQSRRSGFVDEPGTTRLSTTGEASTPAQREVRTSRSSARSADRSTAHSGRRRQVVDHPDDASLASAPRHTPASAPSRFSPVIRLLLVALVLTLCAGTYWYLVHSEPQQRASIDSSSVPEPGAEVFASVDTLPGASKAMERTEEEPRSTADETQTRAARNAQAVTTPQAPSAPEVSVEEQARLQAEAQAVAAANARAKAIAAEEAKAQAERQAAAAAKARADAIAAEQARAAAQAAAEQKARREAEAAREATAQREARQAAVAAAEARAREEAETAKRVPEPDSSRVISDQDMYTVQSRFIALVNAIESKNMAEVERLTVASERKQAYLNYLFGNFKQIDAAMVNIRASRLRQTISGTLQIRHMMRDNGDRVFPPAEFRNIPVHSTRLQDWSRISW